MNLKIEACCDQQYEFIHGSTMYELASAGLGAGKSKGGAIKSLLLICENPGLRICVTAPTYKVLQDATYRSYAETFQMLPDFAEFLQGDNPYARCKNGSEVLFRSTDKPDTLRGMEVGAFHMDEPRDSPYYAFQVLQGRLRQRNKHTGEFYPLHGFLTTTPRGLNWIYTEFVLTQKPDHKVYRWATKDNKFLPQSYAERLERDYKDSPGRVKQELEGEFLNLEGECVFSRENLMRKLTDECLEPKYVEDAFVNIWKEPFIGKVYAIGADCADEGGGGANCAVVYDVQTGEEVCEIWGDIASDQFATLLNDWGRKYNNGLLGIERNGVGNYIVAKLEDFGYPNLYRDEKGKTGWYTHVNNRTTILEEYHMVVDRNQTVIRNAKAIEEMLTFVRKANDKWEHIEGCRDDRVMARAIAWKMETARWLSRYRYIR